MAATEQSDQPGSPSLGERNPTQGIIEIVRDRRFLALARKCGVLLDGKKVGELWVDEKLRIEADPGEHVLQVRLSWVKSNPHSIVVRPGEITTAYFGLPRLYEVHRILVGPFYWAVYFDWR